MIRLSAAAAFAALVLAIGPALAQAPAAPPSAPAAPAAPPAHTLLDPTTLNEKAPATYVVKLDTSKGPVTIEVTRAWAPNGADRFYNLVKNGFFDNSRFFRVVTGFVVQFGISADPKISLVWRSATIPDDPVVQSNKRGYITFATSGPNTRTTQLFIDLGDNSSLDKQGFAPFGMVIAGMSAIDQLYAGYGDGAPYGHGPDQNLIQLQGNAYLTPAFPSLDYIKTATIQQ